MDHMVQILFWYNLENIYFANIISFNFYDFHFGAKQVYCQYSQNKILVKWEALLIYLSYPRHVREVNIPQRKVIIRLPPLQKYLFPLQG